MKINLLFLLLSPLLIYSLNFICKKFSFLLSYTGEPHQRFVEKNNIPMSGGLILLISFLFYFNNFINILFIYFVLIFLIGLFSDLNIISSPIKRFILQLFLVFIFIYLQDIQIKSTRFIFLDKFLDNEFFSYIFVIFCMMILINGTNFIDGLNTLVLGYYSIVSVVIIKSVIINELNIDSSFFFYWTAILVCLYIFNLFKKLFLGDGGAYLLGFMYGYLLISIYILKYEISPFFIVLLLWYPCFENFFSIIRKYKLKRSPISPDTKHFHQLLFHYIRRRYLYGNTVSNSLSANIINLYNLVIFFIGSKDVYNTQLQLSLILINIFVYTYLYLKLFIYRYKKNV